MRGKVGLRGKKFAKGSKDRAFKRISGVGGWSWQNIAPLQQRWCVMVEEMLLNGLLNDGRK
jgi:hypothetical protein